MNRKERRASAKQNKTGAGVAGKVEQAIAFSQAGEFDKAEPLLNAARKLAPNDAETLHQLGTLYVRTGRSDAGIGLLKQAVEARPQEYVYWNNLAAAYLSVEMTKEAVEAARKTVALNPGYAMAWQNLAFGLRDFGDHAGAAEAFAKADKTGVMEPASLASWGESLGSIGRLEEGEQTVRRALVRAQDDPAILTLLGWLLVEQKKDDDARETLKRSLELRPDQFLAAFNYGVLLLRVKESEPALRWLRRATSIDPRSVAAWRILALELYRHGLKDEALPAAERVLRLAPDDAEAKKLLGQLKGAPEAVDTTEVIDFAAPQPLAPSAEAGKKEKAAGQPGDIFDFSTINIG
jgi:predicted Zn-dependent protease